MLIYVKESKQKRYLRELFNLIEPNISWTTQTTLHYSSREAVRQEIKVAGKSFEHLQYSGEDWRRLDAEITQVGQRT